MLRLEIRRYRKRLLLLTIFTFALLLLLRNHAQKQIKEKEPEELPGQHNIAYSSWKQCIYPMLEQLRGTEFWDRLSFASTMCEFHLEPVMKIKSISNRDEYKFHVLPRNSSESTTLVTIGIGEDITAEQNLRSMLQDGKIEFFGADPVAGLNQRLYSLIGKFFNFAVGAKTGMKKAKVLQGGSYTELNVESIDISSFFTKYVQRNFIDALWLDVEGAEYELFRYFSSRGELIENDFTICQINMEIHSSSPEKKELVSHFFKKIMDDSQYVFLKTYDVGHIRTFLVNFGDPRCALKYWKVTQMLQEEIDKVTDRSRPLELSDKQNTPYLNATITETLRVSTLGPFNFWRETLEDTVVGDFLIPKGTAIAAQQSLMFSDPTIFSEPEEFRPERFIENSSLEQHVPAFGMGKRACLGESLARAEMYLIIGNFLLNFDLVSDSKHPASMKAVDESGLIRKAKPFKMIVSKRS